MPEITIKYKSAKSLEVLKDLSKYFDFEISAPASKNTSAIKKSLVKKGNGVNDDTMKELTSIFSMANMDAKKLRKSWKKDK